MAYEKQTWETGDIITAEKLNHIEDGISDAGGGGSGGGVFIVNFTMDIQTMTATADKTFAEVKSAYDQYQTVIGVVPAFDPADPDIRIPLVGYAGAYLSFVTLSCMADGEGTIIGLMEIVLNLKPDDTATVEMSTKQF